MAYPRHEHEVHCARTRRVWRPCGSAGKRRRVMSTGRRRNVRASRELDRTDATEETLCANEHVRSLFVVSSATSPS
jgi:hypothetical protein